MLSPVQIDGSFGEGGGQIIRTSVSLAAMTGRPVQIDNVRARRAKPGLQPQHLAAVRAAAALCKARLTGDNVGSSFLYFEPQTPVSAGEYHFDIGTAGAAPLVVQTVLIPLALSNGSSKVTVTGGTHVPHSPSADFLENVYIPTLQEAGLDIKLSYSSAGFYPKGGGQIEMEVSASTTLSPLQFTQRDKLKSLHAFVLTSNLPDHVAERGISTVHKAMKAVGRQVTIKRLEKPSPGPGAAVTLVAQCQSGIAGFSAVGELRRPMEKVAETPCKEFMNWWKSEAACDEHLADQLVLPMCFARGPSRWTTPVVTEHLRTVLWVVQHFLDVDVLIDERADCHGTISVSPALALT